MNSPLTDCPACGRKNASGKLRCLYCGAALKKLENDDGATAVPDGSCAAPPESFCECPGCGHFVSRRMVCCLYCGTELVQAEQTARLCPRCGGTMKTEQLAWAYIDRCTCCGGEFYDLGELARGAGFTERERSWIDDNLHPADADTSSGQPMNCPGCGAVMETFSLELPGELLVDRCPRCRGTWLDQGEARELRQFLLEDLERRARAKLRARKIHYRYYNPAA